MLVEMLGGVCLGLAIAEYAVGDVLSHIRPRLTLADAKGAGTNCWGRRRASSFGHSLVSGTNAPVRH